MSLPWTAEEDEWLIALVKAVTPWEEIANQMPGRTVRGCRKRYYNMAKSRRKAEEKKNPPTDVHEQSNHMDWPEEVAGSAGPWRSPNGQAGNTRAHTSPGHHFLSDHSYSSTSRRDIHLQHSHALPAFDSLTSSSADDSHLATIELPPLLSPRAYGYGEFRSSMDRARPIECEMEPISPPRTFEFAKPGPFSELGGLLDSTQDQRVGSEIIEMAKSVLGFIEGERIDLDVPYRACPGMRRSPLQQWTFWTVTCST
ncbi:uncharacterized protein B0I36DRAFT_397049 [Microdochium trichocladiopsis]|uniref:Myb-like domain-containing protein n=1 Tax=Microdochium trichocladiopsis TaxID=1682393 RepID=A0A9P8XVM2_9PEZI|nr:uncharacterized protein B0I36DRAFT_397049 [Microdochium trichocladiopsis]KAH7016482.1 hypothetical protein B0I36DRAFT_397049 [Microdochium trichocladiopsis]